MVSFKSLLFAGLSAFVATTDATAEAGAKLPVFFFHGMGNATDGALIEANLTAEERTYTALDFCENACSVMTSLSDQVRMAIKQIRGIVAKDAAKYVNGYHFLAHAQGASIARGVIEEMDDHKVNTFISMAGDGNGNFYGPQDSDDVPMFYAMLANGPRIDSRVFDFSKYVAVPSVGFGKFQRDLIELVTTNKKLQAKSSVANIIMPPLNDAALVKWKKINPFLPKVNNLENCGTNAKCIANQKRRKANFSKLKAAHFFGSPQEDIQAPWQTSVLGKYSTVATLDKIETKFSSLKIVGMKHTVEYKKDLYGLKTLDTAGRLHIHKVPNVSHFCWVLDYISMATNKLCKHQPIYNDHIYPLLK